MKTFIMILVFCVTVLFGNSITELKNGSSKVKVAVRQCLIDYGIDPAVLELDIDTNDDVYANLSEEKKGCVTACVYKGFNWLTSDGSLDIDLLCEGDTPEESELEKERYVKIITQCRAEGEYPVIREKIGKDDCKFFNCLNIKDL